MIKPAVTKDSTPEINVKYSHVVIPAQAGIHEPVTRITCPWVPAYAGTTVFSSSAGGGLRDHESQP
ncbi:MAG: hypothetical protein ACYCWC_11205 [Rhodocyclaceae bacterium]